MESDMHTNYWIIQHLFWNVALKHGCVFRQKSSSLSEKFVFSEQSEALYCPLNHTLLLALVDDQVRTKGVQMKAVNGISMRLDLGRVSAGEGRESFNWT